MVHPALLVFVLLVGACVVSVGFCAGALFTYRLLRGLSPIPSLPVRARTHDEPKPEPTLKHPPKVSA